MILLKEHFAKAVENKHYPQVAALLYLVPELFHQKIHNQPLFDYAHSQDKTLTSILWALCPNDASLHTRLKLKTYSEFDTLGQSRLQTIEKYQLDRGVIGLDDAMLETLSEQLYILLGLKPESRAKSSEHQCLRYVLESKDLLSYCHLMFYSKFLGLEFQESFENGERCLNLKSESIQAIYNVFEANEMFDIKHVPFEKQSLSQPEKIQAFELCFNSQQYLQQVLARCQGGHRSLAESHMSLLLASWFKQVGHGYLESVSFSLQALDHSSHEHEKMGGLEYFTKTLRLPSPDSLLSGELGTVGALQKEMLFEICFTPKQFIEHYIHNLPNDALSRSEFLESDLVKYQQALRVHMPEGILQEYGSQLGLSYIRRSKNQGYFVAYPQTEHQQEQQEQVTTLSEPKSAKFKVD